MEYLESSVKYSFDCLVFLEKRVECLVKIGKKEEVVKVYCVLVDCNVEYFVYYEVLEDVLEIFKNDVVFRKVLYKEYVDKYLCCDIVWCMFLDFLIGRFLVIGI